ncbi:hypothetical protein ELE36_18635 [Pseudolysobacter antarcticus]|uniref:Uncharacterized protein n=1 Tax=Pseudolysobacter antarcticus TaxID=2511995 RepID=A0A411HNZ1_9GAMM|nr:hypothetical protein [Pseudolysobacter antarcticus]QBB72219.1 hypothetical protein ELE36_18635 [Pseudolysobacter antarcticus]
MQKNKWTGVAVATLIMLMAGYEWGKLRVQPAMVSVAPDAAHVKFDATIAPLEARDGWQKIVAQHSSQVQRGMAPGASAATRTELPSGPFGRNVASLEQLADAGNADAAYALAQDFRACQYFVPPKNAAEVERGAEERTVAQFEATDQLIDQLKITAKKQRGDLGDIPEIPVKPVYQENLDAAQQQISRCTGVDSRDAKNWKDWQTRATELGNRDAQLGYWLVMLQDADVTRPADLVRQKQLAITALQSALSAGDPRALAAIGEVLDDGLFAEPNEFLAYAYFHAASQVPYAAIGTLPWVGNHFMTTLNYGSTTEGYFQQHLSHTGAGLSPIQQLAAQQLGIELFAQCCRGNIR